MKRIGLPLVIVVIVLGIGVAAQVRAEVALKAAIELEEVKGDLKGAIEAYKKITDGPGDRAVRAQALVRLGDSYHKLGDAQAKASFERVVREFGDQPAAVQARAKLARLARPSVPAAVLPTNRMVWQGTPSFYWFTGAATRDGRSIAYIDWERTRYDLAVLDLSTGKPRIVLKGGEQPDGSWSAAMASVFSPDGSQLAYSWRVTANGQQRPEELRAISVSAPEGSKPRTLFTDSEVASITPRDWSSNGEFIAVDVERRTGTREVGVVSARSGALRIVKQVGGRRWSGMFFSPDNRYLLFDLPQSNSANRDVVAIELSGGRETTPIAFPTDDALLGFTPDGLSIVFASARSGAPGIWTATFANGSVGEPVLAKSDVRVDAGFGVSTSGSLIYSPPGEVMTDVRIGQLDMQSGRFKAAPSDLPTDVVGKNEAPRFSPDGRSLAFISQRLDAPTVVIREMQTGAVRTFPLAIRAFRNGNYRLWRWTSDGKGLLAIGTSLKNETGIHYIDVATGLVAWTIPSPEVALTLGDDENGRVRYSITRGGSARDFVLFEWNVANRTTRELYRTAEDCRHIRGIAHVYCPKGNSIVRRDITTKTDTVLAAYEPGRSWSISPEDKFVTTSRTRQGTEERATWLVDIEGRKSRELPAEAQGFAFWWAPGDKAMLVSKQTAGGNRAQIWWVPTNGAQPHLMPELDQIDTDLPMNRARLGGDEFVFTVTRPDTQWGLFVLENFLPASDKKRASVK